MHYTWKQILKHSPREQAAGKRGKRQGEKMWRKGKNSNNAHLICGDGIVVTTSVLDKSEYEEHREAEKTMATHSVYHHRITGITTLLADHLCATG